MQQPCDGVTVVDFSQSLAGALTTMFLADTGAEVITVEPPGGDPLRGHPAYLQWRRGQKSVALDLTLEDDQATARRLAARADAVIEAFRPGVAERLGVGYETLGRGEPAAGLRRDSRLRRPRPLRRAQGLRGYRRGEGRPPAGTASLAP